MQPGQNPADYNTRQLQFLFLFPFVHNVSSVFLSSYPCYVDRPVLQCWAIALLDKNTLTLELELSIRFFLREVKQLLAQTIYVNS